MSHVTCHMSGVRCQVSGVRCHICFFVCFFGHSGGASRGRVCYQRGLPRLVYFIYYLLFWTDSTSKVQKKNLLSLPSLLKSYIGFKELSFLCVQWVFENYLLLVKTYIKTNAHILMETHTLCNLVLCKFHINNCVRYKD